MDRAVPDSIFRTLARCLQASKTAELCGFIVKGVHDDHTFVAVPNLSPSPACFTMSSLDVRRVRERAVRSGGKLTALVHSHSTDTRMSIDDEAAFMNCDLPWLIVSLFGRALSWHYYKLDRECNRVDRSTALVTQGQMILDSSDEPRNTRSR